MNELELLRALRDLPAEREPALDLWPAIAEGIKVRATHPRRRPVWWPLAMAASMACAAILLWPTATSFRTQQIVEQTGPVPAEPGQAQPMQTTHPLLRQADALSIEYRSALAQLAGAPMPAELRTTHRELRNSERALREALRLQPESTWLLGQLRRTYEQQLRLSQIAALG